MCFEQTSNRSQKSAGGIIGNTKRKKFVAQWEMIYHEMMAVLNYQCQLSGVTPSVGELHVKQDFNSSVTRSSETILQNMIKYIKEHENPLSLNSLDEETDILHNIVTQEIASKEVCHNLGPTWLQKKFIKFI